MLALADMKAGSVSHPALPVPVPARTGDSRGLGFSD